MIRLIILSLIFVGTGCVVAQFAPKQSGRSYSARTGSDAIQVFRSQRPEKTFFEIGSVTVSGNGASSVRALKEKAAEVGGDAIIDVEFMHAGAVATVIRFKK